VLLRINTLHRWVPLLGAALALAALGSLRELHRHRGFFEIVDNTDLVVHLFCLGVAGLGIHAGWRQKSILDAPSALRVAGLYLAAFLAFEMLENSVFDRYRYESLKEYFFFANDLLVDAAGALFWGCALVRCQDPMDPDSRRRCRILSILLAIGMPLKLYAAFLDSGYSWWTDFLIVNLRPKRLLMTSFRCLPTVLLFRAIVKERLPVRSAQQAGRGARSVFWDLLGWFLSHAGWWGYAVLYSMLKEQSYGRMFWRGLLTHALLALIALTTFLGLAKPEPEAPALSSARIDS
jgi:hypothetical protein